METIYIQPIFAPDQLRFERNLVSLHSWFDYCDHYGYRVKFAIGGWAREEYWGQLIKLIDSRAADKIVLIRLERNYGKATTVNVLYNKVLESGVVFKHILTADSDILFPIATPHMIERLEELAGVSEWFMERPFGLCGLNQLDHCCHLGMVHLHYYNYRGALDNHEHIVFPDFPGGIAGGCLFVSRKAWERAGGYRVMGVYAGDDGHLLWDVSDRGFSIQMADSISIIHPQENDQAYFEWKDKLNWRDSDGVVKNLEPFIQEADEFWGHRNG